MIQEEFVTLETAKLLKEKGFNERKYLIDVSTLNHCYKYLSVPPQSVAQKWLRDTKCLHIEIGYMYGDYWLYDILTIPTHDLIGLSDRSIVCYNTYEEALEAGLQEALKLI
jgi:hypothetical protein